MDMLCKQGRMHPEVARFPNTNFYAGKLDIVGLPHQLEESEGQPRVAFIPSEAEPPASSAKINHSEANIAAK
jgi:superfamily I DNA and/or RNA helicase